MPGHTDGAAAEFWTALALKAAFLALDPPRVPSKQGQIDGCWTALGQAQRHSVLATLAGAGLGGGRGLPRAGGAGPKGRALGKALLGLPPGPPPFQYVLKLCLCHKSMETGRNQTPSDIMSRFKTISINIVIILCLLLAVV